MSNKRRLFLMHWNKAEIARLAAPLRKAGWQVQTEAEDGARAGKRILADPPAAVVIYLTRLPSHGRETADYLRSTKAGRSIPILFVDGAADKVATVREKMPEATFTTSEGLLGALAAVAAAA
jgi:DNA-binding response OmpR family regulator